MGTNSNPSEGQLHDLRSDYNTYSVDQLFRKYGEIGFLYPEKLTFLLPFMDTIKKNWKKLSLSTEDLLWIMTLKTKGDEDFASVSVIKQSNYGLLAQHLVSTGNPFYSLKVMLDAQYRAEHVCSADEVRSSQNWFRPNNRYAFRIFSSMFKKIGPLAAFIKQYDLLHLKVDNILPYRDSQYKIEEVSGIDQQLIDFVKKEYSEVFVKAEELNEEDVLLSTLNKKYNNYGLSRYRRICKIIDSTDNSIKACVIANRAPLGLNFSFLENRCYYIVDSQLQEPQLLSALASMNSYSAKVYDDFNFGSVSIVTGASVSASLQKLGAQYIRSYVQSIWLREGFSQWYDHIYSFLEKIQSRLKAA